MFVCYFDLNVWGNLAVRQRLLSDQWPRQPTRPPTLTSIRLLLVFCLLILPGIMSKNNNFIVVASSLSSSSSPSSNNLPLLAGILRTYQVSACDNETIKLECDSRTVVNIVVAQYGQPVPRPELMCRQQQYHQYKPGLSLSSWPDEEDQNGLLDRRKRQPDDATGLYRRHPVMAFPLVASTPPSSSSMMQQQSNDRSCPEAFHLRYKFLLKIEETCREQHRCGMLVSPSAFGSGAFERDPCPAVVKFAEVAYKCRPNKFVNKIVCEGRQIELQCDQDDRIVIFSASFGSTWNGVHECPDSALWRAVKTSGSTITNRTTTIVPQQPFDCQVSYATETVMSNCHGKRNCTVKADTNTFGVPKCPVNRVIGTGTVARNFLKVVYTCVAKRMIKTELVFVEKTASSITTTAASTTTITATTTTTTTKKPNFERIDEAISEQNGENSSSSGGGLMMDAAQNHNQRRWPAAGINSRLPSSSYRRPSPPSGNSPSSTIPINCTELTAQMQVVGFVSDWISAIGFMKRNQERFVLYLLVSLFGSLVCFLAVLSARLYYQKGAAVRKVRQEQTLVPQFEFDYEDDDDDDDGDNGIDNESGNNEIEQQQNGDYGGSEVIQNRQNDHHRHQIVSPSRRMPVSVVGMCEYPTVKRPQSAYSTIRRPHSSGGSLMAPADRKQSSMTLGRNSGRHHHHHHHHHQQQQQPQPQRYSTTTMTTTTTATITAPATGYHRSSSSSASPTTTNIGGIVPPATKSILRDSRLIAGSGNVIDPGGIYSQMSAIDMIPPPPPPTSSTNPIGDPTVPFYVMKCPKFPVAPSAAATERTPPPSSATTTTTTTTTAAAEGIESSESPPGNSNSITNTEPKILMASGLGNFLI